MFLKFPRIKSLPRGLRNSEQHPGEMTQASKTFAMVFITWRLVPDYRRHSPNLDASMDIFIFLFCKPYTSFNGQFSHPLFYPVFSYHTLLDTLTPRPPSLFPLLL